MPTEARNDAEEQPPHESTLRVVERVVALGMGVFIVGLVSYLILSDKAVTSVAEGWVRTLLALGVAVLAGTLSGEIHVDGKVPGLTVRAGGAVAVFVLVFLALPKVSQLWVSPQASLDFAPLTSIDLRSYDDPATPKGKSGSGLVAITFRVSVSAKSPYGPQQVQPALIRDARLSFMFDGIALSLPWLWLVTQDDQQLPESTWLSTTARRGVGQKAVHPSGPTFTEEILFLTDSSHPRWRSFVDHFASGNCLSNVKIVFSTVQQGKQQEVENGCPILCTKRIGKTPQQPFSGDLPPRIGKPCGEQKKPYEPQS